MNVLILCHGNRWRSVTCLAMFKHLVAREGNKKMLLSSAGFAHPGKRPPHAILEYCKDYIGEDMSLHRSSIVSRDQLNWADVIVYMDGGNKKRLDAVLGHSGCKRIICLAHHCEPASTRIKDPAFMATQGPEFRQTLDGIKTASLNLYVHLVHPEKPTQGKLNV